MKCSGCGGETDITFNSICSRCYADRTVKAYPTPPYNLVMGKFTVRSKEPSPREEVFSWPKPLSEMTFEEKMRALDAHQEKLKKLEEDRQVERMERVLGGEPAKRTQTETQKQLLQKMKDLKGAAQEAFGALGPLPPLPHFRSPMDCALHGTFEGQPAPGAFRTVCPTCEIVTGKTDPSLKLGKP